ncbi:FecR family protein [Pedobacter sp. L105]|uniref:FecR family protein n=1 Tax=Pedobacter sp. L105 TaxID=1641871 RepID=UPI00131D3543|nr:FecR family protein [Pedobacter sp. L105]
MNKDKAEDLIKKYLTGETTPEEEALLENWYDLTALGQANEQISPDYATIEKKILTALRNQQQPVPVRRLWPRYAAAASILALLTAGLFYYKSTQRDAPLLIVQKDIHPGGNNAILTLANGKKIALNALNNGNIITTGNITISKNANGQITYQTSNTQPSTTEVTDNTITTPKGGQWRVILSDGTNVWLNASSEITYPQIFKGAERIVRIKGEAYFEVAKDKEHPFIVKCDQQEVKVFGTHFNINSYSDEPVVKTTLLEGSVQVSANDQKLVITPGEQAIKDIGGHITAKPADLEEVMAWKNNSFHFENTDVKTLMRQIARWYDIEVKYEGQVTGNKFAGELRRDTNLANVLKIFEQGGIHFRMEGRILIVTAN